VVHACPVYTGDGNRHDRAAGLGAVVEPPSAPLLATLSSGHPALLAKAGGCGTHAPASFSHAASTRTGRAYSTTGVVRQSSPKPRPCLRCSDASQGLQDRAQPSGWGGPARRRPLRFRLRARVQSGGCRKAGNGQDRPTATARSAVLHKIRDCSALGYNLIRQTPWRVRHLVRKPPVRDQTSCAPLARTHESTGEVARPLLRGDRVRRSRAAGGRLPALFVEPSEIKSLGVCAPAAPANDDVIGC
jgi:hypothetical protein